MKYTMFIDDIREPKKKYDVICRSTEETLNTMIVKGCPNYISFAHDLGGDDNAMKIVKFMVERDLGNSGNFIPSDFSWNVHSANPVGAANINGYLKSYFKSKRS